MIYDTNLVKVEGDVGDSLDRVLDHPKTLMFFGSGLVSEDPERKRKLTLTQELVLDYYHTSIGGLALQKDSEFLQLFNHYTLKAKETGCYYHIHRRRHMDRYMRESFGMQEPQPLGIFNVVFCFVLLGTGIGMSILQALVEYSFAIPGRIRKRREGKRGQGKEIRKIAPQGEGKKDDMK